MFKTHPIRLVLVATVAALAIPAVAQAQPRQPSPVERIVAQENARKHDPALYGGTWVAGYPGPSQAGLPSPIERLIAQEAARRNDPAIYGGTWAPDFPRPVVEVSASGDFRWVDASVGAAGAFALVALGVGASVIARSGGSARA
jgi:hypothetical protein